MYGPIKSVFEGASVQDPNPLLLRRAPSKVRHRRCHANFPSLLLCFFLLHFFSVSFCPGIDKMANNSIAAPRRIPIGPDHTSIGPSRFSWLGPISIYFFLISGSNFFLALSFITHNF